MFCGYIPVDNVDKSVYNLKKAFQRVWIRIFSITFVIKLRNDESVVIFRVLLLMAIKEYGGTLLWHVITL